MASWLTSLYGFFSHMQQKQYELAWKAKDSFKGIKAGDLADAKKYAPQLAWGLVSYVIVPAMVEEFVTPYTNSEKESWGLKAVKTLGLGLSSSLIGIRDVAHALVNLRDPTAGLISTFLKTATDLSRDISHGKKAFSKEKAGNIIKHSFALTGALT